MKSRQRDTIYYFWYSEEWFYKDSIHFNSCLGEGFHLMMVFVNFSIGINLLLRLVHKYSLEHRAHHREL